MTTPSSSSSSSSRNEVVESSCQSFVRHVIYRVNTVSYLIDTINELGRSFSEDNIRCLSYKNLPSGTQASTIQAGYIWLTTPWAKRGDIVLLEERMTSKDRVELALRHELIHAFDDARGFVDPRNCLHHACSEIRAARLSGDCLLSEEMDRGHFGLWDSGRKCVVRRAGLSVEANPFCRGFSVRAVNKMFSTCYTDYEPFAAPIIHLGNFVQGGSVSDESAEE